MKQKTIQRGLAALLCVAMLLSLPALAIFEENETPEIPVVSETDTVAELPEASVEMPSDDDSLGEQAQPLTVTVESFSVTLPTGLSAQLNVDGSRSIGAASITNNGAANIMITDVSCKMADGWTLLDYEGTDPNTLPLGERSAAISMKQEGCANASVSRGGVFQYNADSFSQMSSGNSAALNYDVLIPPQATATNAKVMDVTFVVTAYHSYSCNLSVENGYICPDSDYDGHACVQNNYSDAVTCTLKTFDQNTPISVPADEITWYKAPDECTLQDIGLNDWQICGTGASYSLSFPPFGIVGYYIKVCWNNHEEVFRLPPMSSH